jgi:phenylalanyl-tRNA synthetase alpha chain
MSSLDQLESLRTQALSALEDTHTLDDIGAWEKDVMGRKGTLTQQTRMVGQLPAEERPAFGRRANEIKQELQAAFETRAAVIHEEAMEQALTAGAVDITLPGRPVEQGHLHLTTQSLRELYAVFALMGFEVYEAPDVELEAYNFDLLNIPEYHPARDMWDTFWVDDGDNVKDRRLLRTHTSPGQIRVMLERYPEPIRVVLPGKCYRYEQITVRSEHQFYQLEGLAVGRGITLTDLIGTMELFARLYYGPNHQVRVRSSYFPFTEPSVEVDTNCILCDGEGCAVCKYSGWLEIAGAGMVQPQVLRNGGYDPDEWSGFAFGLGVERPSMMKYSVKDIRYYYGNDLRFLRQF